MSGASLYERIGGEIAMMAAIDLFYEKVLADDVTRPFFEGTDMDLQARKQVSFMSWAFGGPKEYRGRDLRAAHAHLVEEQGLSDLHFEAVTKHLEATLRELGIADDLVREALALIDDTRAQVLNR